MGTVYASNVYMSGQLSTALVVYQPFFQSYLAGLQLSNDGTAPATTIDVTPGIAADSTNSIYLQLGATITKNTNGAWAAGSGTTGMGTGLTVAANTWYHVFAIQNSTLNDVYFDTSPVAANAPANTTNFRRIGSFLTNAGKTIVPFTQNGNEVLWKTPVAFDYASTVSTVQTLFSVTVPTGVNVWAIDYFLVETSGFDPIGIYAPDIGAQGANLWIRDELAIFDDTWQYTRTNTSGQIAAASHNGTGTLFAVTMGWLDYRGQQT